jgi:hypothetical protein
MAEKKDKEGRKNDMGGGSYNNEGGSVHIGGNAIGTTIVTGKGNIVGAKGEGVQMEDVLKLVRELRAALPTAGLDDDTLAVVDGDVKVVEDQLAKAEPKKHLLLPKLTSVVSTLTGLVGAGEAVQKLLPMAQQAVQWVQQVVK